MIEGSTDYAALASGPDGTDVLVRLLKQQNDLVDRLRREKDDVTRLLTEQIETLKSQVQWLQKQLFGRKSEKIDPAQLWMDALTLEAVEKNPPSEPAAAVETRVEAHTRKCTPHGRAELPEHLPREINVIDVPESERVLPDGTPRPVIGHEDAERIGYRPGQVFVQVTRRMKYGSPTGSEEAGVVIAPLPDLLVPRCKADESLLAHLVVSKYIDHLPLYRIEQIFRRSDITLARTTMCDWLVETGLAIQPLVDRIRHRLFQNGLLHSDDTPVDLQDYKSGKPKGRQMLEARLWVASSSPRDGPWTVYDFTLGRGGKWPRRFFTDYSGAIVCDAYSGYDGLEDETGRIQLYGCWAHARRYFLKAHRSSHPLEGAEYIALIRQLYQVEREIQDGDGGLTRAQADERRLALRTEKSAPILASIRERMDAQLASVQPGSALGKALSYTDNNWDRLKAYAEDPRLPIDNNPAEQMIRPIAVGRKNWLFFGSERGGRAAANLMSLVATCKRAGVEPLGYLHDVFKRLPSMLTTKLDDLLPGSWTPLP